MLDLPLAIFAFKLQASDPRFTIKRCNCFLDSARTTHKSRAAETLDVGAARPDARTHTCFAQQIYSALQPLLLFLV